MRSFLLDTNVVSAFRTLDRLDKAAFGVIENLPIERSYVSVISILEIEIGIKRMERRDGPQAAVLRKWSSAMYERFDMARILPFDHEMALLCAALHVPDKRSYNDAMLAATALARNLTLVTRNVSDFAGTGVVILDPWNA